LTEHVLKILENAFFELRPSEGILLISRGVGKLLKPCFEQKIKKHSFDYEMVMVKW